MNALQRYDVGMENLLTTNQVAAALNVLPSTIRAYLARSQMPEPDVRYGVTALWRPTTLRRWRPSTFAS